MCIRCFCLLFAGVHLGLTDINCQCTVAHTWLRSIGFWSWSRFLAVSLQMTWIINPTVGCRYFPPGTVGVNSLPKTVAWQRRDCNLNPGPSAPESSMLTTRLLSDVRLLCASLSGDLVMPQTRRWIGDTAEAAAVNHCFVSLTENISAYRRQETDWWSFCDAPSVCMTVIVQYKWLCYCYYYATPPSVC